VCPELPYGESKAMADPAPGWYDRCLDPRSVSLRAWPGGSIEEDWTVTIDYPTPDGTATRDDCTSSTWRRHTERRWGISRAGERPHG
jgi:hypothetical protein